jgi:hypothetical protein
VVSEVPWLWPGAILALVLAVPLGRRVARPLGTSRLVGSGLVVALGIVLAATLTPGREALESGAVGGGSCDLSRLGPASVSLLLGLNEQSLNVLLFIPFGAVVAWLPGSPWKAGLVLAAFATPFAIELLQMVVRPFDRACESADVIDNLTGLLIGIVAGVVIRQAVTAGRRRRVHRPERS